MFSPIETKKDINKIFSPVNSRPGTNHAVYSPILSPKSVKGHKPLYFYSKLSNEGSDQESLNEHLIAQSINIKPNSSLLSPRE